MSESTERTVQCLQSYARYPWLVWSVLPDKAKSDEVSEMLDSIHVLTLEGDIDVFRAETARLATLLLEVNVSLTRIDCVPCDGTGFNYWAAEDCSACNANRQVIHVEVN